MPSDVSGQSAVTGLSSDSSNLTSQVVTNTPDSETENQKMFDYQSSRVHLQRLIDDWNTEVEDTEVRRKTRKLEIDTEGLRQKGDLDEDETIIPVRTIHANITREQPPYINYVKNSRRIAIFECLDNPDFDCDLIEQAFTKAATYTSWEKPIFKCLDGSQAHGWDAVEIVQDDGKPGHFAVEHIGHDKLLFPRSAIDLQQCPRIIRCYDVTNLQLRQWVQSYGFDKDQVELVLKPRKETQKEIETIRIYKLYFKNGEMVDGKFMHVVYVAWFCLTDGCIDWLRKPEKFYCGVDKMVQDIIPNPLDPTAFTPTTKWVPKEMTLYPIFILPYQITEEGKIVDCKGRCFLDEAKQEAQTAMWSAYVNSTNRASRIFASPAQEDGTGAALKEVEDILLRGGRVFNRPIQFWSMPYPDASVLKTLQYAEVSNDQETNQVNFAAMNREDSRKTAKEIGAAQQQQQLLNSVQLTLFSTFIREIYSFAWLIVQSQAIQNKIKFLLIQQQGPDGQPVYINNIPAISQFFSVRAAGDVDVILKQELEQKFQQDWAIISQTKLALPFLIEYIKLRYPNKGDQWAAMLQQGDLHPLVASLTQALTGLIKDAPQEIQKLPPEQIQQLTQLVQQGNQVSAQLQQQKQPTQQ